ncbi:MAG: c-type cytochrome biogenesis protein CcsB [Deltaproteobacteria bacterium]|nr:MAG: c-type cytochrome biogenesis protein CcsB [Deltaproteobacteria bacterium]
MNAFFLKLAALFYLAGSLSYLAYVVFMSEKAVSAGRFSLLFGFGVHLVGFLMRYFEAGYTPITNLFESLSFFSLAVVGVFLVVERRYRLKVLGAFVSPIAFILILFTAFLPSEIQTIPPALQSYWLPIHATLLFVGDAIFAVAFAAGIIYLIQERQLKRKKLGPLMRRLPPLDVLDEINHRCLTFGFPLLTVGIITGAIWAEYAWGSYWSWDPKETWSLITWLLYAALLHGRLTVGWRGRKAAILAIVGFGAVLFTFLGVNLLLPGLHSYASFGR